jgi:phosphoribosyl 1,2-cyclic phosphodiesterase
VAYARAVGARRLVLFHHDPDHSDRALERLEDRARQLAGLEQLSLTLAREGMAFEIA